MASTHVWTETWTMARRPELGPALFLPASLTFVLLLPFASVTELASIRWAG